MRLISRAPVSWRALLLSVAAVLVSSGCGPSPVTEETGDGTVPVENAGTAADTPPFAVSFAMPDSYVPGASKALVVSMDYIGEDPVTALALRLVLPEGWQYGGVSGALRPAMEPAAGARGELTFVWIQVPAFPAEFECMVDTPAGDAGAVSLTAQAVYRRLGGEERSPAVNMELEAGE